MCKINLINAVIIKLYYFMAIIKKPDRSNTLNMTTDVKS